MHLEHISQISHLENIKLWLSVISTVVGCDMKVQDLISFLTCWGKGSARSLSGYHYITK